MNMPKNTFDHHVPSASQIEDIQRVRTGFKELEKTILELAPSRERSVAITNLETSAMWAIKGIIMADEGPVNPKG